jgi:hypothetical protein
MRQRLRGTHTPRAGAKVSRSFITGKRSALFALRYAPLRSSPDIVRRLRSHILRPAKRSTQPPVTVLWLYSPFRRTLHKRETHVCSKPRGNCAFPVLRSVDASMRYFRGARSHAAFVYRAYGQPGTNADFESFCRILPAGNLIFYSNQRATRNPRLYRSRTASQQRLIRQ